MNKKLPYKDLADTVASRGRYGDTTLIHVNPIEVEGLASLMPLTRNPDTGYPEAFLPLLAPFLGTALGTALGAGAGLSGLALTAAGAGGSALATTAATGSVEEGLLAGLTGFGLGSAMQGAQGLTTAKDVLANPNVISPEAVAQLGEKGVGTLTNQLASINPADIVSAQGPTLTGAPLDKLGIEGVKGAGITADLANAGVNIQPALGQLKASTPMGDVLTSGDGLKAFGSNLMKPTNLVPTAAGLGGIAVEQDRKAFEAANQFAKDERVRKREQALRDYQEQIPGVSTLPTPGYAPGLNNNYAQSPSIGRGNIFGANGGRVKRMRFKNAGSLGIPNITYNEDGTISYDGETINTDGSIVNTGGSTVTTGPTTTAETVSPPNAPPSSEWLMNPAYDPYSGTGTRGRGLAPTPLNYMAGFMPEYQYVTNIQPTATSLGAVGAGGTYQTPFGTITVPTTEGNVDVAQEDPSQYVGGSAYNEYLLGNQAKGMPSYLDSYLQNQPYYQYQDQVLNDIWGGGGYGTPDFMGYDPYGGSPIMPQPVNPLQTEIDSLNARINDLLTQIEGKDATIAEELATDQASRFGSPTPDPKSDLIVQEGDNAGLLNVESDIFDYLSPTQKQQYTEYNYLDKYLSDLNTFGADTANDNFARYVTNTASAQTDYTPGSLTGGTTEGVDLSGLPTIDPNTGNTYLYTVVDGKVRQAQLSPGGLYSVQGEYEIGDDGKPIIDSLTALDQSQMNTKTYTNPFDMIGNVPALSQTESGLGGKTVYNAVDNNDGTFTYTLRDENGNLTDVSYDNQGNPVGYAGGRVGYADGGRIRYAEGRDVEISTLEDYMQPLPFNPADRFVGSDALDPSKFDASLDTNIDPNIEVDPVEELMKNPVIQEKMSEGDRELLKNASYVILGRLEDDGSILQRFVELFGEEAYERLKSELMPEGEQNIGLIEGEGGGMDDMVDGQLGDQQKVALSPGEYILPADVVSDLGDGNNEQGAAIMDDFMERVRLSKHGTTEQPDPINLDNVMPA